MNRHMWLPTSSGSKIILNFYCLELNIENNSSETIMLGHSTPEERHLDFPDKEAVFTSLSLWIIIYLLSLVSLLRLKKFVRRMTVVHLIIKGCTTFGLLLKAGVVRAFTQLTMQSIVNLNNISAWREAVIRVVITMTLGDFSHVMLGALGSDMTKIGSVSFLSGFLSFSSLCMDEIMVNSATIALCQQLNLPQSQRYLLFSPPNAPMHLTMIPTTFEILPYPRLWNLLYFGNKMMAILFRIILNIHFLLEAVTHRFPTLSSYKKYTSPIFCALAWSIGIVLQGHPAYEIRVNFQRVTIFLCQYFNVFFFAAMVSYVYGVRRFCDDIHFLRKSPPNLYWMITWMLLPIFLLVTISAEYLHKNNMFFNECLIEMVLMFSPYLVLTSYETIKKIIERKTITLITPEAKWGPREAERRIRRRQFNPRKATRYMMESMHCHHICIIDSKLLKAMVTKEAQVMARIGGQNRTEMKAGRRSRRSSTELIKPRFSQLSF